MAFGLDKIGAALGFDFWRLNVDLKFKFAVRQQRVNLMQPADGSFHQLQSADVLFHRLQPTNATQSSVLITKKRTQVFCFSRRPNFALAATRSKLVARN